MIYDMFNAQINIQEVPCGWEIALIWMKSGFILEKIKAASLGCCVTGWKEIIISVPSTYSMSLDGPIYTPL
jgi:hypothetical protein